MTTPASSDHVPTPAAPPDETATALVDRLVATHHAYTRQALATLVPLAHKVAKVHADVASAPRVEALVLELADELLAHLSREQNVLFPWIRALDATPPPAGPPPFGALENPLRVMALDHDRALSVAAELRRATGGFVAPAGACRSWRALWDGLGALEADLLEHLRLENDVLFPNALELERRVASGASRN